MNHETICHYCGDAIEIRNKSIIDGICAYCIDEYLDWCESISAAVDRAEHQNRCEWE